MVFGNRKEKDGEIELKIGDDIIERVIEIKLLRVEIDDKLTWRQQENQRS